MQHRPYNIDGFPIDIYFTYDRFLNEIIQDKEYDYLFKNLVILDIGANIGTFSWSMYQKAKMIYALEISAECVDCMNKTIEVNHLDRIKTFHMGLAESTRVRNVSKNGEPGLGGWKLGGGSENTDIVETIDLEAFLTRENIPFVDVMKIDIEGGEREVFESPAFQRVSHRIHTILGEYHGVQIKADLPRLLKGHHVTIDETHSHFIARRTG